MLPNTKLFGNVNTPYNIQIVWMGVSKKRTKLAFKVKEC